MQYIWIILLIVSIISFVIYVIIDNFRVKVIRQDVKINHLPDEFNGYKILQLSDLHSRNFGKKLYNLINSLDYDIIVFTGDMMDNNDYEIKSLINIIKNIKKKDIMLYVDGNNGPIPYDLRKGVITEFGKKLESLGIILLEGTYVVESGDNKIAFSNFDIATKIFLKNKEFASEEFKNEFKNKLSKHIEDIRIGVGHYPVNHEDLEYMDSKEESLYHYDLIIAGHYHGGQIRIPFYGAFFIPNNVEKKNFFPEQKYVSGLNVVGNVNQYVSRGLGASGRIGILKFRLFNTPNIDLIRLKK